MLEVKGKELICAFFVTVIKNLSPSAKIMHRVVTIALKKIMNGSTFRGDLSDLAVEREILTCR